MPFTALHASQRGQCIDAACAFSRCSHHSTSAHLCNPVLLFEVLAVGQLRAHAKARVRVSDIVLVVSSSVEGADVKQSTLKGIRSDSCSVDNCSRRSRSCDHLTDRRDHQLQLTECMNYIGVCLFYRTSLSQELLRVILDPQCPGAQRPCCREKME